MLAAAIALALAYWGPGQPVQYHVVPLPGDVLGQTTCWDSYCEVQLDQREYRWGQLCSVVLHETGHAAGLGHSTDRLDVMYPVLWRTADACRGKRPARYPRGTVIHF